MIQNKVLQVVHIVRITKNNKWRKKLKVKFIRQRSIIKILLLNQWMILAFFYQVPINSSVNK